MIVRAATEKPLTKTALARQEKISRASLYYIPIKPVKDWNLKNQIEHATYPATKTELVALCNSLSDFSDEDKKEFAQKLPEGTYNSADQVSQALGL